MLVGTVGMKDLCEMELGDPQLSWHPTPLIISPFHQSAAGASTMLILW